MYLGIDQSLRSSGVAVVSEKQQVTYLSTLNPKKLRGVERLAWIRESLRVVLASEPDIKYAALEGYAYDVGAGRVFELGEIGGVVKMVLHDAAIPFLIVPPASLKQFVADHGQAKKEQMRAAVLRKWKVDVEQDDECDALGLAQVARSFHLNKGTTRSELEVLKKLRDTDKKISLVSFTANVVST
jgi:Holliday junction resolvasome RuvABC endonuclease subunit